MDIAHILAVSVYKHEKLNQVTLLRTCNQNSKFLEKKIIWFLFSRFSKEQTKLAGHESQDFKDSSLSHLEGSRLSVKGLKQISDACF